MALFQDTFTGTLTPVGTIVSKVKDSPQGALAPSGSIGPKVKFTLPGALTPTGVVSTVLNVGSGIVRESVRISALFRKIIRLIVSQER